MVPWSLLMPSVHWRMVLEMDDFVETTQLCGNILRFYAEAQKNYGADRTHSWRWDGGRTNNMPFSIFVGLRTVRELLGTVRQMFGTVWEMFVRDCLTDVRDCSTDVRESVKSHFGDVDFCPKIRTHMIDVEPHLKKFKNSCPKCETQRKCEMSLSRDHEMMPTVHGQCIFQEGSE